MDIVTLASIRNLGAYSLRHKGVLIVAPRREGKSSFLVRLAESSYLPPLIVTPNKAMQQVIQQTGTMRCLTPRECEGGMEDLCIDEIDFVWSSSSLCKTIPWNQVVCATTSRLDFDRIQGAVMCPGVYPEYDWIKHIVIVLPPRGLGRPND